MSNDRQLSNRLNKLLSDANQASIPDWGTWTMKPLRVKDLARKGESPSRKIDPSTPLPASKPGFQRDEILKQLRLQAMAEARQQGYAEGFEAARAEGYAQGLTEGMQAATQQVDLQIKQALSPLMEMMGRFTLALADEEQMAARAMSALALRVGKMLAQQHIDQHPEAILEVVKSLMLQEPELQGGPALWLATQDCELVKRSMGQALSDAGWQIRADQSLARGSCRITTAKGEIESTLEQRWDQILDRLQVGLSL
jgi:flagellar assembly protein FliH